MKRICLIGMILALMLTGCAESEPATVATISPVYAEEEAAVPKSAAPVSAAVTVNSVDGFLDAIGSGAEILLEPGYYDLSTASDYGTETDSPYYSWVDIGDGYQLTIRNAEKLTLQGSGREATELVHTSRYANVLVLQDCSDVTLYGFTAGHTEGGECAGGVIHLQRCRDTKLQGLSVYGCGTTGVRTDSCMDVELRNCEIYDCSSNGIQADATDGLLLEDCSIHDLGSGEFVAGQVFWLQNCTDVNIRRCNISDNRILTLLNCRPSAGIELRENVFARNQVQLAAFDLSGGGLVMDDCDFVENRILRWFAYEGTTVLDGIGKSWDEKMLEAWHNPPAATLPTDGLKQVTVSNVHELLAEIAPNTELILKDGTYDFSQLKDYGTGWTNYRCWNEEFDGPELVLRDLENLVIRSESGDPEKCILTAVPRYADVLSFRSCSNITVSGITAGHTVEPGYCTGGVLHFEGCDNVLVNNCGLYGCGILGVQAEYCSALAVTDCEIYECSYGGISVGNSSGIRIENCSFRDLGGEALYFYDCREVTVDGEEVSGNARLSY